MPVQCRELGCFCQYFQTRRVGGGGGQFPHYAVLLTKIAMWIFNLPSGEGNKRGTKGELRGVRSYRSFWKSFSLSLLLKYRGTEPKCEVQPEIHTCCPNGSYTYLTSPGASLTPYCNCKQLPQSPLDYLFACDIRLSVKGRTGA